MNINDKYIIMKNYKTVLTWLISILFVVMACNRVENLTFDDFDKDNDGLIDMNEFQETFTANYYDDWDRDDDPYLDDEDFHTGVYNIWDADDDQLLSEEEWLYGFDYYYGNYVITDFDDMDVDDDDQISYSEYYDALSETNFYSDWDIDDDKHLSEEELAVGVFSIWDVDNSGLLEPNEYEEFDAYYLDI